MIIKTDILSYKIRRQHELSSDMVSKAMERLSTGLRVNSSSDDSAGLAVSTRLTSLAIANQVGTSNEKDSLNLFHTIDNSLSSTEAMLQRIKEQIIQSKNGTLSSSDKQAIQEEVGQITAGIEQTSKTTSFNSKPIINNSLLKFNGVDHFWRKQFYSI